MKLTKKNIVLIAEAVIAILAFVMLLLPCVVHTSENALTGKASESYNGFEAFLGAGNDYVDAAAGGVILLILLILMILLPIANFCIATFVKKSALITMCLNLGLALLSLVACVFFFCGATDFMTNLSASGSLGSLASFKTGLGVGAILGAIFSLVDCAAAVYDQFFLKG